MWTAIAFRLGPRFLSRTGEQFYGVDKWGVTQRSLLEVMADPSELDLASVVLPGILMSVAFQMRYSIKLLSTLHM